MMYEVKLSAENMTRLNAGISALPYGAAMPFLRVIGPFLQEINEQIMTQQKASEESDAVEQDAPRD